MFYQFHALRVPVVFLEPASFEKTEIWDSQYLLKRVYTI